MKKGRGLAGAPVGLCELQVYNEIIQNDLYFLVSSLDNILSMTETIENELQFTAISLDNIQSMNETMGN